MTEFMKPNITVEQVGDNIARFVMEPLERGYGQTLGNGVVSCCPPWTALRQPPSRSRACSTSSRPLLVSWRMSPTLF